MSSTSFELKLIIALFVSTLFLVAFCEAGEVDMAFCRKYVHHEKCLGMGAYNKREIPAGYYSENKDRLREESNFAGHRPAEKTHSGKTIRIRHSNRKLLKFL